MTEQSAEPTVRLAASRLPAGSLSPGARVSASAVVEDIDATGITLGDVRVVVDGDDVAPPGRRFAIAEEDALRSAFKKHAARLAWMIPAGICASLLLALVVAADYNDLVDVEPRYWELLLKVIAVGAGLWFLYAVARARGLKTSGAAAREFAGEIAWGRRPPR